MTIETLDEEGIITRVIEDAEVILAFEVKLRSHPRPVRVMPEVVKALPQAVEDPAGGSPRGGLMGQIQVKFCMSLYNS